MKRRAFIGAGALTIGAISLPKIELFANQSKAVSYVGIGRGGCNILAYVKKQNPTAKIT
jgi:S-adenosylmethionine:diacylglycerol 3-amino-3-carboxypropyl transferase